ncbi:hypothetical protein [Pseudonocardia sp. T1-2H]|uniref:hypothetical protein n=1 Tax=Pseudonocardia sp. T1-2H TaxID=3128899 RepID=UPI00310123A2
MQQPQLGPPSADVREQPARTAQEVGAGVGEVDAAAVPDQQPGAELVFRARELRR